MLKIDQEKLKEHLGKDHEIELAWYSDGINIYGFALECTKCYSVIAHVDIEDKEDD